MVDAHAEADGSHPPRIRDLLKNFLNNQRGPRVVGGVEIPELGCVISTASPRHMRHIDVVVKAEVLKRAKESALKGFPEPELDRHPAVKPQENALLVGSFGRCRKSEEFFWRHVIEEPPVSGRFSVVELIDDDDLEVIGR